MRRFSGWTSDAVDKIAGRIALRATKRPTGTSKYRNTRVEYDGMSFDSRKEMERWIFLKAQERAGLIHGLERQIDFSIEVNGMHICTYRCDATYIENSVRIVEDTKSVFTRKLPVYRLKKKLLLAVRGIDIKEV